MFRLLMVGTTRVPLVVYFFEPRSLSNPCGLESCQFQRLRRPELERCLLIMACKWYSRAIQSLAWSGHERVSSRGCLVKLGFSPYPLSHHWKTSL